MPVLGSNYLVRMTSPTDLTTFSNIAVENLTLTQQNTLNGSYFVGGRNASAYYPNGPQINNISYNGYINFLTNASFVDPTLPLLSGIKVNLSASPILIKIGNKLTGLCYLENYQFNITPNNVLKTNVQYVNYHLMSGSLEQLTQNLSNSWDEISSNGASCYILDKDSNKFPIFSLNYQFSATYKPEYKIGSYLPFLVNFIAAEENFQIDIENYNNLPFSGLDSHAILGSGNSLYITNLKNINTGYQFLLNFSGCKIKEITTDVSNNDILVNRYVFTKYY